MSKLKYKEVPVEKLRWQCDPESLGFKITDDLKCCDDIIGQERALKAIKLGLEVKSPGYNIFVAGLTGTGKTTTIKHILERIDTKGAVPDDICYVYNFTHHDSPRVLSLPAVKELINELKEKFTAESVQNYLDDVQNHILQNLERFHEKEEKQQPPVFAGAPTPQSDNFLEYKVNVLVDNSQLDRVPVIIETAPNYKNLFGTIERTLDRSGVWHTDFTKIKAGSILKANGGYLVLNLLDTLVEQGGWVALKRTLKNRKLDIQAFDPFYLYSTFALKPEAVDVKIKVVIVGDANLYQLLYFHIYPIITINQGIEILTGVPAGLKDKDGDYPKDSVNFLADSRLKELALGMKDFFAVEEKK